MQWKWRAERTKTKSGDIWYAARIGPLVWRISKNTGRPYRFNKAIKMHRELAARWGIHSRMYDHANGNGLDNRRENIRPATYHQNNANCCKRWNTRSRFKGVCWHKQHNKWYAQIQSHGVKIYLGLFVTQKEAALAYNAAARSLFGEFARVN